MGLAYQVAHALPGRIRVRVAELNAVRGRPRLLECYLATREEIRRLAIAAASESVVIHYDHTAVGPEDILSILDRIEWSDLRACLHQPTRGSSRRHTRWLNSEVLRSSSIALVLIAVGRAAPVVPWLLVFAVRPIFRRARKDLMRRKMSVDVLDATAVTLLFLRGDFRTAALMVWLVNVADVIRDSTVAQSRRAVDTMFGFALGTAWRETESGEESVCIDELQGGDIIVCHSGDLIPVDGEVASGTGLVDQHMLTGESMPVEKKGGSVVFAGTAVMDGRLRIRAEKVGKETEMAKIVRLIEDAPLGETRVQNYAEKWADGLVPYSLGASALSLLMGDPARATSVLIPDYGTGIRVAAPTTVLSSITKAVTNGILIKGGRHLEKLAEIDCIVFDKTGTLTSGDLAVVGVATHGKRRSDEVLALAASADQRINHPVAKALVKAARSKRLQLSEPRDCRYTVGLGVRAWVDGAEVMVGNLQLLQKHGVSFDDGSRPLSRERPKPVGLLYVACDGELIGTIEYADPPRSEAPEVLQALQKLGIKEFAIVTGDQSEIAEEVSKSIGISKFIAEVFPGEKASAVQALQARGFCVAFVGDGINDSPAIARADVGIAMDGGADVARESADVILLRDDLWLLPKAIAIARESMRIVSVNWKIISIPNTIALAAAAVGALGPIGATVISNGATVVATANALRPLMKSHQ